MKRLKTLGRVALISRLITISAVSAFCVSVGMPSAMAQLAIQVTRPDGSTMDVTARNASRGDDSLILYDNAFGTSTRTNAFGVEVIAVPAPPSKSAMPLDNADTKAYQVQRVTSVWDCAKDAALTCGNAAIPPNGIVLSAVGNKRDALKQLREGDVVMLHQAWAQQKQTPISVINPTPQTNPAGSGFPGYRASNQIVVYDAGYGRPTTGTNEFGFEVTVRNGIVTAQEGSDSSIPSDGFVLSGHGRGRSWLIANAPVGSKMTIAPDGKTLTSTIDFDTYVYQFDQLWAQSPCSEVLWRANAKADPACGPIREQKEKAARLNEAGQSTLAANTLSEAVERLNRRIWLSYKSFPATTVRGVWHRPVEKTPVTVGQTLDRLQSAGINTVFLETFFHGYTIFPSQTFQEYGLPVENPKFEGQDLLKIWVDEAHKRGMKVHAWFQTFYGGTKAYLPPGPILAKYPQWANVQYSALVNVPPPADMTVMPLSSSAINTTPGAAKAASPPTLPPMKKAPLTPVSSTLELGAYFLDPVNPQVQTFLTKLAEEIVTRYDVDGFQLDYIRYPASFPADRFSFQKTTWGYTDAARNAFKAQYGIDPADINPKDPEMATVWLAWNRFKVDQLNRFVAQLTQNLRQKRPAVQISAAVFPDAEAALSLKQQDWQTWARNGWVDFFAPMTLTSAMKVVDRDTRVMVQSTEYSERKVPVFSGIFGPFNDNTAEHILQQIDTARQAGASGYVLFDSAHLTPRMLEALKVVQTPQPVLAPTSAPAVSPQAAPEKAPSKPKKRRWWRR